MKLANKCHPSISACCALQHALSADFTLLPALTSMLRDPDPWYKIFNCSSTKSSHQPFTVYQGVKASPLVNIVALACRLATVVVTCSGCTKAQLCKEEMVRRIYPLPLRL